MRKHTTANAVAGGLAAAYIGWRALRRSRQQQLDGNVRPGQSNVIVGAGFAGTYAARCLGRLLPRGLNLRTMPPLASDLPFQDARLGSARPNAFRLDSRFSGARSPPYQSMKDHIQGDRSTPGHQTVAAPDAVHAALFTCSAPRACTPTL